MPTTIAQMLGVRPIDGSRVIYSGTHPITESVARWDVDLGVCIDDGGEVLRFKTPVPNANAQLSSVPVSFQIKKGCSGRSSGGVDGAVCASRRRVSVIAS